MTNCGGTFCANATLAASTAARVPLVTRRMRMRASARRTASLLGRRDRVDVDSTGLGVEGAGHGDLLAGKGIGGLLVVELVDVLAVGEHEQGAVNHHARPGALGIGRPHSHLPVTASRA